MVRLRFEVNKLNLNVPWDDLSAAAVALSLRAPVIVLNNDRHFARIREVCGSLSEELSVVFIRDLIRFLSDY